MKVTFDVFPEDRTSTVTLTMTPTVTVVSRLLDGDRHAARRNGYGLVRCESANAYPCSVQVINGEAHCSMTPLLPGLFASPSTTIRTDTTIEL